MNYDPGLQQEFAVPINYFTLREDMAEEIARPGLPQLLGSVCANFDGRVDGERDVHEEIHEPRMGHPGEIGRDDCKVHITPLIRPPPRVRAKEHGLLDLDSLPKVFEGPPDQVFRLSCRLNFFHSASACVKCEDAIGLRTFLARLWISGGYRL